VKGEGNWSAQIAWDKFEVTYILRGEGRGELVSTDCMSWFCQISLLLIRSLKVYHRFPPSPSQLQYPPHSVVYPSLLAYQVSDSPSKQILPTLAICLFCSILDQRFDNTLIVQEYSHVKWSIKSRFYFSFNVVTFFSPFTHFYSFRYPCVQAKHSPHPRAHSHTQRTARFHKPLLIVDARHQFPSDEKETHRQGSHSRQNQAKFLQYPCTL